MKHLSVTKKHCCRLLAVALFATVGWCAPAQSPGPEKAGESPSILQQRYDRAQKAQAAQDLPEAARQYRIFLADALGEMAIGLAQARNFEEAANHFDEALRLVPEFPVLRLQYARAALQAGKVDRAKLEAEQVLASTAVNKQTAAGAHEVLGRLLLNADKDAEAKKELEQAVALDSTFEYGYELAVADLDLGDGKGAASVFAEMIKAYGDQARLHLYFGQAYGDSDFQAQALTEFQRALAMDPRLPGLHYSLAAAYLANGESHLKESEAELRQELALSPNDAPALAALGHLLAGQTGDAGAAREAEQDLERATALDPTDADALLFLGQFYAAGNQSADAVVALRKSIALTSVSARNAVQMQKAHYLLGRLLLKQGESEQGKAELAISEDLMQRNLNRDQKRLSSFLGDESGSRASGSVLPMPNAISEPARDPGALARVTALERQLAPAVADSYNNLGAIAASENEFRAAVGSFQRAAEWKPDLPGLDYNWGRAAFAAGLTADAVGPLQRYVRAHPEDEGAKTVLGLCLFSSRRYAEARDVLAPLQGKSDVPAQVRFAYADSLVETGEVQAGVAQLQALSKADPKVVEVHRALGRAYALTRSSMAVQEYEAALALNPDDVESLAGLAKLELADGKVQVAVANLKHAVRLQPGDAMLQEELAEASRRAVQP